jgi:hypothetical protein
MPTLEAEMKQLRQETDARPWWERYFGAFANDPLYDQAMQAGAKYRKAQIPEYLLVEGDGAEEKQVPPGEDGSQES